MLLRVPPLTPPQTEAPSNMPQGLWSGADQLPPKDEFGLNCTVVSKELTLAVDIHEPERLIAKSRFPAPWGRSGDPAAPADVPTWQPSAEAAKWPSLYLGRVPASLPHSRPCPRVRLTILRLSSEWGRICQLSRSIASLRAGWKGKWNNSLPFFYHKRTKNTGRGVLPFLAH